MTDEKFSISADLDLTQEARHLAGSRDFSRPTNEALNQCLQVVRLREYEAELAAEHGPLTPEAQQRAAAIEWPG